MSKKLINLHKKWLSVQPLPEENNQALLAVDSVAV